MPATVHWKLGGIRSVRLGEDGVNVEGELRAPLRHVRGHRYAGAGLSQVMVDWESWKDWVV